VKKGDHLNYLDRDMNNKEDKIIINTHAMKAYEGSEDTILPYRAKIAPVSWVVVYV
jgi:hypothetical protein